MIFSRQFESDQGVQYTDKKRGLWLFSVFIPLFSIVGPIAFLYLEQSWVLWVPVTVYYVLLPVFDWLIGQDTHNPPESVVPQMERDNYYRSITFALVPLLVFCFVFNVWFAATQTNTLSDWLALVLLTGIIGGYAINLGHEMGHKRPLTERWAAKIALALSAYGHFNVEHNRGHHTHVATPDDSASAKLGENIYQFFLREYPGALVRAWLLERQRLTRLNRAVWSFSNEVLQGALLTLILYSTLIAWLGWAALPFLMVAAVWSGFQLTSANYIEHYGLKRKRLANGQYERCQPKHSWNSNFLLSNWSLLHLQRHSDHHANPMRRYQALRNFSDIPQMPAGYYTMFLMAYLPPLWFRVMDPRVYQAVNGEWERLNILPKKQDVYRERWRISPTS